MTPTVGLPDDLLRAEDEQARRAAVTVFDRPLALEAGAGTGKTATLVARVLAWTLGPGWQRAITRLGDDADPARLGAEVCSRVTAITFTEAAAAEMAERIARSLASLAQAPSELETLPPDLPPMLNWAELPPPAERRRRARALHAALDRLTVRTIHGFAHGLLAAHPLEARIHPAFQVDADGSRTLEVAREVLEERLARELGPPHGSRQATGAAGVGSPPTTTPRAVNLEVGGPAGAGREIPRQTTRPSAAGDPATRPLLELLAARVSTGQLLQALLALRDAGVAARELPADPTAGEARANFELRLASLVDEMAPLADRLRLASGAATAGATAALRATRLWLTQSADPAAANAGAGRDLTELWNQATSAKTPPRRRLKEWAKGKFTQGEGHALDGRQGQFAELARQLDDHLAGLLEVDQERARLAFPLLRDLLGDIEERLARRGVLAFADLLQRAAVLLDRHRDLTRRLRRGIDQLLVDEFQDTDATQCRLVRTLALVGPGEDRPGLFLVGDPKQTIYAWRAADLASYEGLLAEVDAAGGLRCRLRRNFRSLPAVLAEVDRAIAPAMTARPGLQPSYERLVATRVAPAGTARIDYWLAVADDTATSRATAAPSSSSTTGGLRGSEARRREAAALAADLAAGRADGTLEAWSDAAILLRSFTDAEPILAALRAAGIPFEVTRERDYYRRREVLEAAALVRAIADPADQLALVATLRSAVVGVPDAALLPLWRRGLPQAVAALRGPEAGALANLVALVRDAASAVPEVPGLARVAGWEASLIDFLFALAELRQALGAESAAAWVERLRRRTFLEPIAAARYLGRHRLANLERFFAQVISTLETSQGDVGALLQQLRERSAERDAVATLAARPRGDAVQIGTIHAAKGLEFRQVYLPQLDRGSADGRDHRPAAVLVANRWELLLLPGVHTLGWPRAERARREVAGHELVRLLYVAMTRARDRLVLAGRPRAGDELEGSLMALLEPRLAGTPAAAGRPGVDADGVAWRWLPAAGDDPIDHAADEGHDPRLPAVDAEVADDLVRRRRAADARAARRWSGALSAEAHRRFDEADGPDHPPAGWRAAAPPSAEPSGADGSERASFLPPTSARQVAMAVGTALHAALAVVDLELLAATRAGEGATSPATSTATPSPGDVAAGTLPGSGTGPPGQPSLAVSRLLRPLAARQLGALVVSAPDDLAVAERELDRLLAAASRGRLLLRYAALAPQVVARELPLLVPITSNVPAPGPSSADGGRPAAAPPAIEDGPVALQVGSVDLVYRDLDGSVVVADWKTDTVADPLALERRVAIYTPQLRAYASALADAWSLARPPRCQLWFLAEDRLVEF